MGMKGREIVERAGVDVDGLIEMLNKAYSDEWLAYYQYWVGAKVVTGTAAPKLIAEMEEHAAEELDHAEKLAKRIIELGGTPILSPEEWYQETTCGYLVPEKPENKRVLARKKPPVIRGLFYSKPKIKGVGRTGHAPGHCSLGSCLAWQHSFPHFCCA